MAEGEEEDGCGETSLVSLLCSPCSSPLHKTCGKSKLFFPASAFHHKPALPVLLPALICCEETHRSPHHMLYALLCFLPQSSRFCSKPVLLTAGCLRHTEDFHTSITLPLSPCSCCLLWSALCLPLPLSPSSIQFPGDPEDQWCHSSLHGLREVVNGMIFGSSGLKLHPV